MSPFKLTAITTSAPSARHTDTGTGFTKPPSTSHSPPIFTGGKMPGNAAEARTASSNDPFCSHCSRPVAKSVATAANGLGRSSIS